MLTLIVQLNKKSQSKEADATATLQPSADILKEGHLEKKGHSVTMFNWAMFDCLDSYVCTTILIFLT